MTNRQLLLHFARIWGDKYGSAYKISWAKDGAIIKNLRSTYEADQLHAYMDFFINSFVSSFADRAHRTLGIFSSQVNQVAAQFHEAQSKTLVTEHPDYQLLQKARNEQ